MIKINKKIKKRVYTAAILFVILLCSGCKKTKNNTDLEINQQEKIKETTASYYKWYYFSEDNYVQIDKLQNVPVKNFNPWTEAVRISSANNLDLNTNTNSSNAFALVNRLGMLCFNDEKISLKKDISLFSEYTAGNLVFYNNVPVFSVYKSSFFNDTISKDSYKNDISQHYFLVQFDDLTGVSYPILNCNNITDETDSVVVDYFWDGKNWICCLKNISANKVSFSYVKWTPVSPLLSLSPVTAANNIIVTETNVDTFRNAKSQSDYSLAPDRVKKLLEGFSKSIPFSLDVKTAGGYSSRKYLNSIPNSDKQELKATAIISESWSAALFEDGTLYIEGALPGKHILRAGKPIAIRLPKLPPQFVYSDFIISGTTLYAAWEETDFFKINRSGFISVDLDSTLYKKIR